MIRIIPLIGDKSWTAILTLIMRILLLIIFSFSTLLNQGQNETKKWYFGLYGGLDFMINPPNPITNSSIGGSQWTSMTGSNGNILYYTDGASVFNSQNFTMQNGNGLNAGSYQGVITERKPGSNHLYYIFTVGLQGLYYSLIDMNLAAGQGSVVAKNVIIDNSVQMADNITAVKHCNGVDLWLVCHESGFSTNFKSYLVTANVIGGPVVTTIGNIHNANSYLKLSSSGRRLAWCNSSGVVELFDFNLVNGTLSNSLSVGQGTNGISHVEFSPDESKLYFTRVSQSELWQLNLCAGTASAITSSQYAVTTTGANKSHLQLGNNGKLYVARDNQIVLGVVNNPNVAGASCNYVELGQIISPGVCWGLPNFVTSYFYQPTNFGSTVNLNQSCFSQTFTAPPTFGNNCLTVNPYTNFTWNFGDPLSGAANTSTVLNPVHVFSGPGSYTVKLIVNYPCRTDTLKQTFTINGPNISVITQSVNCQIPGSASLTTSGGIGPYTYTWLPSSQNGTVASNLSGGIYTVLVHDSGAGCVNSQTCFIASNLPNLTITATSPSLCSGATVTLNASGANTFTWNTGATSAILIDTPSVTTTYSLEGEIQGCVVTKTYVVVVFPNPVLTITGSTLLCSGETTTLSASGAHSYTWSNGFIGPILTLYAQNNATYFLQASDTNNCWSSISFQLLVDACLGMKKNTVTEEGIYVYPNPFSETITIDIEKSTIFNEPFALIYDVWGREVKRLKLEGKNELRLAELSSGLFLLMIKDGPNVLMNKTILKE